MTAAPAGTLATGDAGSAEQRRAGILLMLLTGLCYVTSDALAKLLTQSYPVLEVVWGRFFFHLALLLPILLRKRLRPVSSRPWLQVTRSLLQVFSSFVFFAAIVTLPLATATSLVFVSPLVITALSVPLLGEKVGPRRWAAVAVGFIGVLVIVRPGVTMEWAALLVLTTAVSSALYQIVTRLVAREDPVEVSLFYTAAGGALLASLLAPTVWVAPDLRGWALLVALGGLSGIGHLCVIMAFARAPAAVIAPFTYTQLIWATGLGWLFFGQLPDLWTIAGAAIIAASGIYVFYRESVRRRGA